MFQNLVVPTERRLSAGQLAVLKNVADKLEHEELERYLLNVQRRSVAKYSGETDNDPISRNRNTSH